MKRLLVVSAVLAMFSVSPAADAASEPLSWLALGDSYSSGEGIPRVENDPELDGRRFWGKNCQRATGRKRQGTAWAAAAYELVREDLNLANQDFFACTGATTDDISAQLREASTVSGRERWDLISLSIGGNNLGFADVVQDCTVPRRRDDSWLRYEHGCTATEDELRARIDRLVGERSGPTPGFEGEKSIVTALAEIAGRVRNGGDVVLTGYPQLIEEPSGWVPMSQDIGMCSGVEAGDARMLRGVTGYLNQQLAEAVIEADEKYRDLLGVRFHFVDIAGDPYESSGDPADRHGLCSEEEWINGLASDEPLSVLNGVRFLRLFHPNQDGHTATGSVVGDLVREEVSFDDTVGAGAGEACGRAQATGYAGQPVIANLKVETGTVSCPLATTLWEQYWSLPAGTECRTRGAGTCYRESYGWRCHVPTLGFYPEVFACSENGGEAELVGVDAGAGRPTVVDFTAPACSDCSITEKIRPGEVSYFVTDGPATGVRLTGIRWERWSSDGAEGEGSVVVSIGDGTRRGTASITFDDAVRHPPDGCGNSGDGLIFTSGIVVPQGVDPVLDGTRIPIELPPTGCETY